jgi:hypothetical protein
VLRIDVPVLQHAVRHCARATAVTAPESASLERIDEALLVVRAGTLTIAAEPGAGSPRLPEVFQFFTTGDSEHITDPRTGHDRAFCRRNTRVAYGQPTSASFCSACCTGAARYLLLAER